MGKKRELHITRRQASPSADLSLSGSQETVHVGVHSICDRPSWCLEEWVNFIQKPFSIKDLAVKVREALGK
jgi:hypothetical protein